MEINEFIAEEISYKVRKYSYTTKTTMRVRTKSATAILRQCYLMINGVNIVFLRVLEDIGGVMSTFSFGVGIIKKGT